jgi:LPXTG-motif cell wall-anchored protein
MSVPSLHRNSNIRRAIRTGAGMASFPYTSYAPVSYDAKYDGYGWTWPWESAAPAVPPPTYIPPTQQPTQAPSDSAWMGDMSQALGGIIGMIIGAKAESKRTDAILASNETIAIANAESNAAAGNALLEMERLRAAGRMGVTTIAMAIGGIAILGGAAYYVYRKKK